MEEIYVIRQLSSGLYVGEESIGILANALQFEDIEEAESVLINEYMTTGYYEIVKLYYIDAEQRAEDEEYNRLQEHINDMYVGIQDGMRIQNGEGTNWVGYFRYKPEYEERINRWFSYNEIEFSKLKRNKYYKVTGWDKTVEEVTLQYIKEHISQYTLETRHEWIHTKIY